MEVVSKTYFLKDKDFFLEEMGKGKIFVYPTDTIYGIGCDYENQKSVEKIREIKNRDKKPFSVIVPGKDWIRENCVLDENVEKWVEKLPGKFTLILNLKNGRTLGVRIPDNWFSEVVGKFGKCFVTTSVNLSGKNPIRSLEDLKECIKDKIDYFVEDGVLNDSASTIVNLIESEKIMKRS